MLPLFQSRNNGRWSSALGWILVAAAWGLVRASDTASTATLEEAYAESHSADHSVDDASSPTLTLPIDLSKPWKRDPHYNQNKAYCNIQSAMPPFLIEGWIIVRDGLIMAEGYNAGVDKEDIFPAFSVTKSFSTMIIGKMVELGQVSTTETLGDIFNQESDWVGVNRAEEKKQVVLQDILTMSSGLVQVSDDFAGQVDLQRVLNFVELDGEKGKFVYLGGWNVLSRIILRRSGFTPRQFVQANGLFEAIGISEDNYDWETFGGVEGTASGLITNPRSLAKLGQLYLQNGLAAPGKQLIQSDWVETSVTDQLSDDTASFQCLLPGYGYQWFVDRQVSDGPFVPLPTLEGAFAANGVQGQQIIVIPRTNTVIAMMANDISQVYSYVFSTIIVDNLNNLYEEANSEDCGYFSLSSFLTESTSAFSKAVLTILGNLIFE